MKYLVTGGCGFIGSHLVDALVSLGHDVIVIDNESATENSVFYKNPQATYHKLCVTDYDSTVSLYKDMDCVFHMAAISRIQRSIQSPIKACDINFVGTATVLECCKVNNVRRMIFSSTSSLYGKKNSLPFSEYQTPDPLTPYSVAKLASENLCRVYSSLYGVDTAVLRYFNVYGPREPEKGDYATVVSLFLRQRQQGKPLTVVGSGLQGRDFTHVKDVVDANILASNYPEKLDGEVFNIGTGIRYSVLYLAKCISDNIIHIPERIGEVRHTTANIQKATNVLKYNPKGSIIEYIKSQ
jgi:UDP-glucose 4-epimerase